MKKFKLLLFLSIIVFTTSAQTASRIYFQQGAPIAKQAQNIVWSAQDTVLGATFRFTVAPLDSIKLKQFTIKNLGDSLLSKYTKPVSDSKFALKNGTAGQYMAGDGSKITFPTIPTNNNQLTNGLNFVDQAGARSSIIVTTTGSSGPSTYISGVINIPQYAAPALSFDNTPTRSFVTTPGAANGFQLSATRAYIVNYSVVATVTALLNGYIVLEICPTNSTSAASWIEVSRAVNGNIGAVVPAGYYARLRSVVILGLPTYTYNSGQEVLFN